APFDDRSGRDATGLGDGSDKGGRGIVFGPAAPCRSAPAAREHLVASVYHAQLEGIAVGRVTTPDRDQVEGVRRLVARRIAAHPIEPGR
ncbi:hypothetical protein DF186_16825, partial [Enterococcus hirae]